MIYALFITHFWHYFYWPSAQPWYTGQIWANIFVLAVAAPVGWIWSKTRFWPLNLMHGKLDAIIEHHQRQQAHNEWMARHLACGYETLTGKPADAHPHFDLKGETHE